MSEPRVFALRSRLSALRSRFSTFGLPQSISGRLVLGMVGIFLVSLFALGFLQWQNDRLVGHILHKATAEQEKLNLVNSMYTNYFHRNVMLREMVMLEDEVSVASRQRQFNESLQRYRIDVQRFRLLIESPAEKAALEAVVAVGLDTYPVIHEVVLTAVDGFKAEALRLLQGPGTEAQMRLTDAWDRLNTVVQDGVKVQSQQAVRETWFWRALSWALQVTTVLLAIGLIVWVRRALLMPIRKLADAAGRLARGEIPKLTPEDSRMWGRQDEMQPLREAMWNFSEAQLRLAMQAKNLSEGHYEARVTPRSERDLIAITFNRMADALRAALHEAEQSAYRSGMSEVYGSILHNIGNAVGGLSGREQGLIRLQAELKSLLQILSRMAAAAAADPAALPRVAQALPQLAAELERITGELSGVQTGLDSGLQHIAEVLRLQRGFVRHGMWVTEFNLFEAIDECIRLSGMLLRDAELRLTVDDFDPAEPLRVNLARNPFEQTVLNLIKNAAESVAAWRKQAPADFRGQIELRLTRHAEGFALTVSDNGGGFAPEVGEKLFQRGHTTKETGTGLGLHSAATFAASCGGSIHAESDGTGQGARFVIRLPLAPSHPDHPNPAPETP